ncbi:LacI family DNA-binding transcriptional regulator [Oryzifoliimicrobium ureilyticus]|uniref:LacI family DNA-binding transcriptional regulator n=1 Tax=Oryzifoliimicrobium ureilyticus TaxID=3113724 RepID=UPI00307605FC
MDDAKPQKAAATVADVARAAGVSKATAARVLGRYGVVSDAVRERVEAVAKELEYRPNELARSMTTGRSGTIGVVVGDIENPFFSSAVRGISDVARAAGFNVVLANSGEDVAFERSAVKMLVAKRVDGLIVSPASDSDIEHLIEILKTGRPITLLDRAVKELRVDMATADDRAAASAVAQLLIDRGHRNIAYLTACGVPGQVYRGPVDLYTASVRERVEGFIDACNRNAVQGTVRLGAVGAKQTRAIAKDLLDGDAAPSAIIASDSLIALELFKAARDMNIGIPDRLALVCFHDADWTSVTSPSVTVVQQPVYQLGEAAAKMLIERLKGKAGAPRHQVLPTALIERGSTAGLIPEKM